MIDLIIRNLDPEFHYRAVTAAQCFQRDYPDRPWGIYNCVIYGYDLDQKLVVYRTRTAIIVKGLDK